jgi:putative ABC transport system permease protein
MQTLRFLLRKPGVTLLAIASAGLAIGFSTAAFSVLDAYALRELPVRDPRSLAWIYSIGREGRPDQISWIEYQALAARSHLFTGFLAQDRQAPPIHLPGRDDHPITAGVSDNFFDLLGVRAASGDVFHAGRGSGDTVVITDHYWRSALAGDPAAIGRALAVSRGLLRIAGVLPPGFTGTNRGLLVDLFVPHQAVFGALHFSEPDDPRATDFEVLGRLRAGVTIAQGRAEIDAILRQVEAEGRAPAPERHAALEDFTERSLGEKLSSNAVLLAVAVLLVLIAAANLANLRLVDNEAHRRETAIRLALGASRRDLARRHAAEALLLAGAGLAVGIALAAWLIRLAPALFYGSRTYIDFGIRLDWRTLAFSSAAMLTVAAVGAWIPLADASKRSFQPSLAGGRSSTRASRWMGALVVAQMALVTGGACSAGLLWRSLQNLAAIRPAMDPDRPLLLVRGYWAAGGNLPSRTESLAGRIAGVPGVDAVAWARRAMLSGSGGGAAVDVEMPNQPKYSFYYNQVSSRYFAVTGGRILSGRAFEDSDGPAATPVVMVNAAFARRFLPGRESLGQWVKVNGRDHQIVGVVEDGPSIHLREPVAPYLYFPFAQMPSEMVTYFVASHHDTKALGEVLRPVIRSGDAALAAVGTISLRQHLRDARQDEQLAATVTASLALVALLLAAAGLAGVTLYAVARRTREFGVRMAVGATPTRLARQVLREAGLRILLALPLGWALAYAARRALEKLLYGVAPDDPATLLLAGGAVALIGALAALQPAVRAARTDPMAALRSE